MSNSSDHITRRVEAVAEIFKQANVEWTPLNSDGKRLIWLLCQVLLKIGS